MVPLGNRGSPSVRFFRSRRAGLPGVILAKDGRYLPGQLYVQVSRFLKRPVGPDGIAIRNAGSLRVMDRPQGPGEVGRTALSSFVIVSICQVAFNKYRDEPHLPNDAESLSESYAVENPLLPFIRIPFWNFEV